MVKKKKCSAKKNNGASKTSASLKPNKGTNARSPKSAPPMISEDRELLNMQLNKPGIYSVESNELENLLASLSKAIEEEEQQTRRDLNFNIWVKQRFSVGINDVTRSLERMPVNSNKIISRSNTSNNEFDSSSKSDVKQHLEGSNDVRKKVSELKAVVCAVDCKPCLLVSHLPSLTRSRAVPLLCIEDNGRGSHRLGPLVKLRRAAALGIKARGSTINRAIQDIIEVVERKKNIEVEPLQNLLVDEQWSIPSDENGSQ